MTPQTQAFEDLPQASNPAAVPLNKGRWLTCYPFWPLFWVILTISEGIAAQQFGKVPGIGSPLQIGFTVMLLINWIYWYRTKRLFEHGDALPGVVVATSPLRVAVLTDMTKGFGFYPAVKVVRVPLSKIMGKKPEPGQGLAMVSFYQGSDKDGLPYWKDFHPVPVETGCTDPKMIQAVLDTFTDDNWRDLQKAVAKLPTHEPRLLRMHPPV